MSDAIGTVVSGVIAFAAAIIGAVIAGRYAKHGAEVGGRNAVEAALAQVHGQAAAEHWQWVRSQRHQSYAALIEAYAALDDVFTRVTPEIRGGRRLDGPTRREAHERTLELQAKTSLMALWGPDEANLMAYALTEKSAETTSALLRMGSVSAAGSSVDWSTFSSLGVGWWKRMLASSSEPERLSVIPGSRSASGFWL
ncbi:MAG: hypothetical protein JF597_03210 [Streptomyces sp.]|uniref:hypothetical protein n=1 Tax=Streptomyces sp. TaxID=1931 RepID=UPI0025EA5E9F|nr:hypothetical protein [Streptomyces sp.]MBW8792621.1 hypothetical protein [Streptomyces sp.]